ncbi:porin [Undibacterium sp. SXout7W]|uniref:porin n=1 Tax=Undibacterium sp. SXout7W TaxID=3413049 RepID=UPI003BF0F798
MKKMMVLTGIFASLGAGYANAQSSVQINGLLDVGVASMKNSGDTQRTSQLKSGGMSTSYFGIKGSEELADGVKAEFALAGFLRGDTGESGRFSGDTMFTKDANVALAGSFGRVQLGRGNAPGTLPVFMFNPFGDSFTYSPLVLHSYVPSGETFARRNWVTSNAADSGWSNEVVYSTPIFNGLKANLYYQFGEVAGDNSKKNIGINFLYANGPLGLTAFYQDAQVSNPGSGSALVDATGSLGTPVKYNSINRQKGYFLGASYDMNIVKWFATYQINHDDTNSVADMRDRIFSLGLSAPVGNGKVLFDYANTQRTGSLVGADLKRDTSALAYDYFLSPRTDVYFVFMSDKVTAADRASSVGMGLRHKF